jgi:hypothetical protein
MLDSSSDAGATGHFLGGENAEAALVRLRLVGGALLITDLAESHVYARWPLTAITIDALHDGKPCTSNRGPIRIAR